MVAPVIQVRGLDVGYGGTPILEGVDFDVPRESIFAILGGSGCGKSTVLRHLVGLQRPMDGSIDLLGEGAPDLDADRAPPFGMMFQSGALFGSMTLRENVMVPLRQWTDLPRDGRELVATARLRLVGLEGFENHLPAEISGGMKKRAGIARALALDPPLLFLDEPSAGLDPISAVELDELLLELRAGIGVTTVLVTHELESLFKIADDSVMLDRETKGVIARGCPRDLRDASDPRVRRFFRREPQPKDMTA